MTTVPDPHALADALLELEDAQHRLWVLRAALAGGEIDTAAAEVVAGDADAAIARALQRLQGAGSA
jgi:hypothetical protein